MQGLGVYLLVIDRKDGSVTEVKVLKSTGYKRLDAIYVVERAFSMAISAHDHLESFPPDGGVHVTGRANIYHGAR